mgnify:CR=1 FL=1
MKDSKTNQRSILLIVPYFGQWPFWFDAYLLSIAKNTSIDWLFITDCEIPKIYPSNSKFVPSSLIDFNHRIDSNFGFEVPLSPRKICDIRVAFGDIFKEELQDYDFWGYCDVDIIWGDIRKFITGEKLNFYDIISSRKENTSGHFTIFRNNENLNTFYKTIPDYQRLFQLEKLQRMDEEVLSSHLKQTMGQQVNPFKVCWDKILLNSEAGRDSHQEYMYNRWLWKDGKIFQIQNGRIMKEVMYLHFINWKRTLMTSEIIYDEKPSEFYISSDKIHLKPHSRLSENFRLFLNLFDGYQIRESRRLNYKRRKKSLKKIINRLKF